MRVSIARVLVVTVMLYVVAVAKSQSIRDRLVQQGGAEYLQARSEALALSQDSLNELIGSLRTVQDDGAAKIVAGALEVRTQKPALALEYDGALQHALANAETARGGGKVYFFRLSREDRDADKLAFEQMLKRTDLPGGLQWHVLSQVGASIDPNPSLVEPLMTLLQREPTLSLSISTELMRRAGPVPDDRVPGAIAAAYRRVRLSQPVKWADAQEVGRLLRHFRTEAAGQAAASLVVFEQQQMTAAGMTPWDDPAAVDLYVAARKDEVLKLMKANGGEIVLTETQRSSIRANVEDLHARAMRRLTWLCVQDTAANVAQNVADGQVRVQPLQTLTSNRQP